MAFSLTDAYAVNTWISSYNIGIGVIKWTKKYERMNIKNIIFSIHDVVWTALCFFSFFFSLLRLISLAFGTVLLMHLSKKCKLQYQNHLLDVQWTRLKNKTTSLNHITIHEQCDCLGVCVCRCRRWCQCVCGLWYVINKRDCAFVGIIIFFFCYCLPLPFLSPSPTSSCWFYFEFSNMKCTRTEQPPTQLHYKKHEIKWCDEHRE